MNSMPVFPGTKQHQALLRCIVAHYQNDARIRSVIVFGSLGRGNWDAYSDIDLDVITADEVQINVPDELRRLCEAFAALDERAAMILPDGDDAGDVVMESLMQLSVRYHSLADTKPAIIDSLQVLSGRLDRATITEAGNTNRREETTPLNELLDACVRYAAVGNVSFQRKQVWATVEVLHRMRNLLMGIFARTHGGFRGYQSFESEADPRIQERLGATLPGYGEKGLKEALERMIDVIEGDLGELSKGELGLSKGQRIVLSGVRERVGGSKSTPEGAT